MRILFLSHRLPFPPDKGDKIRAFHFIRCLAKKHEVDIAALADDPADLDPARHANLKKHCRRLDVVWRSKNRARAAAALFAIPQGAAASLPFFYSAKLAAIVSARLARGEYDAVIAHSAPMAKYVPATAKVIRIADLCDVDSEKWQQYAERAPWPKRLIFSREAFHLRRWESRLAREWDCVAVASAPEAAIFRKFCSEGQVAVLPNGVDSDFFSPRPNVPRDAATVLFMGAMDYLPNIEGVLWFHKEVWPKIRAAMPHAAFTIVGPRPVDAVRALGDLGRTGGDPTGTRVTGYVDDVRDPLSRATVAVAPLHIARGVQNKVLEAMAAGVPVVSTTAAWEGVFATPGRDLLTADTAERFADSVLRLLRTPALREALGVNGRAAVVANHSWDAHGRTLESLCASGRPDMVRERALVGVNPEGGVGPAVATVEGTVA